MSSSQVNGAWPSRPTLSLAQNTLTSGPEPVGLLTETIWRSNGFDLSTSICPTKSVVANNNLQLDDDAAGWQKLGEEKTQSWSAIVNNGFEASSKTSPVAGGPPPGFTKAFCSCDETAPVTARCAQCNEDMCDACVIAHQRVKLTRAHTIVRYMSTSSSGNGHVDEANGIAAVSIPSAGQLQPSSLMGGFNNEKDVIVQVYKDAVEKAKVGCKNLIAESKSSVNQMEDAKGHVSEMMGRVETRFQSVKREIHEMTAKYTQVLKEREKELIVRLEKIRSVKIAALEKQKMELNHSQSCLSQISEELTEHLRNGRDIEYYTACNRAMGTVRDTQSRCGAMITHEDEVIDFAPPDPKLVATLASVAYVGGSGYAPLSLAEGDGLKKAILSKDARFIIVARDQLGEPRTVGGDPVRVQIAGPDGRPVRHNLFDGQNGTYRVVWKPTAEGEHVIAVTLKDCHIQGSPFHVKARVGRNYFNIGKQLFEFGGEGEADGQLCRPWGVCCSREGYILVANRSNNRIEVFTSEGKFDHKFGTSGKGPGQFERPASVTCDRMNRVIVADKDNHRIQILTVDGDFLMMFGEKGSKTGQFNYPWDVACNSRDFILVSDTRNHRIQLFTANGEFVAKYGFEGRDWKHFDSPRGVCFTADDQIVVTDFNNHRLLVVKSDFTCAQYLGKEGIEDGMFTRPNGVAVDEEGNIIVADSRNDRIQIFSSSGVFINKFGTKGDGPSEFDRPSGVCISPDGLIIVVDFANNRVQVF